MGLRMLARTSCISNTGFGQNKVEMELSYKCKVNVIKKKKKKRLEKHLDKGTIKLKNLNMESFQIYKHIPFEI